MSSRYLFEYVRDKYGVDLKNDLSVKMPSVLKDEDGNLNIFTGDGTTKLAEYLKDSKILNMFNQDGTLVGRILGENGDYLFVELNQDGSIKLDDQGNPILVSMRQLKLQAVNTDRKMGYIVTEEQDGTLGLNLGNSKLVGELSLGIEDYNQGKLVVARTVGDLVYLGTQEIDGQQVVAQNLTAASLNHMDLVCGDIEYRTNPVTGVKETYIKSAGGVRISRGVIDPETGEYVVDEHGEMVRSEFGVYDENNLTGGIVIDKINHDETQMKIGASHIDIEGIDVHVSAQDLADFGVWTDSNRNQKIGLVVQKINSGDVASMISGSAIYIGGDPTKDLNTKVTAIDRELNNKGISITRIDTQVTAIGGDLTAAQANIAQNGESITALNTDVVSITGRLEAAEATIGRIDANYINAEYLTSKHTIAAGDLSARHFYIDTGIDSEMGSYDLRNCIAYARITEDGNGLYTLHFYKSTGGEITMPSGYNLTFSKAASDSNIYLDGSWSGGKITVVGKSVTTGSVVVTGFDRTLIDDQAPQNADGSAYTAGPIAYIPVRARYGSATPYAYQNTGFRATAKLDTMSVTSNGLHTYTPTSGKIGAYQVNVNVAPDNPVTKSVTISGNVYTPGSIRVASKVSGGTVGSYKSLSFSSGIYTIPNSTNNHCVAVKDGSTIVGLYSVETMYSDAVAEGENNIKADAQAAKTWYPTNSTQTIISAGKYISGAQKVGAVTYDVDASKILSGTTIKIGNSSNSVAVAEIHGTYTPTTALALPVTKSVTISGNVYTPGSVQVASKADDGTVGSYKSLSFSSGTYTIPNSTNNHCVAVKDGSTIVGLYSVETMYSNAKQEGKDEITANSRAESTWYTNKNDRTIAAGTYIAGTQTIKGVKTANISAGNIKYNVTVTVGDEGSATRISNVKGTFTSVFSDGQTGAAAAQILSGYSGYVNGKEVKGSITVKGATTYNTKGTDDRTIAGPICFTEGFTLKGVVVRNLTEANVKYGVRVRVGDANLSNRTADVTGTFTSVVSSGQTKAAAAQIRSGYSAFVDGEEVKGTMASQAAKTWYPTNSTQTIISAGKYISGAQKVGAVTYVADASKILSGTTIKIGNSSNSVAVAEIHGTYTPPSSTPSASNILIGNTQYNVGQPSGVSSYTDLDSITTLLRNPNNKRGFIYFKATISGGTGAKWYRFSTPE